MTRRELIGMGCVGVVALAIAGRFALTEQTPETPAGSFPVRYSDAEWRARLSPASYGVLRKGATEARYSSPLLKEHRPGTFACAGCGTALFRSQTKYDSQTGWPSFWEAIPHAVVTRADGSLGMSRTEVLCSTCGGHLGHLFTDGPKPTGLRYCMNGLAMTFEPATT
jgi:peptide-methionine (R)-S-oxide reductase